MTAGSSNALKWVLPLLLVALGGWLLYSFLHNPTTATPSPRTTPPPAMAPQTPVTTATPTETYDTLSKNFNSVVSGFTNELASVTDAGSAEAAVPRIRSLTNQLEGIHTTASQLPADLHGNFTSLISSSKSKMQSAIDKVMDIPGVSDVLKPAVDDFMKKIAGL